MNSKYTKSRPPCSSRVILRLKDTPTFKAGWLLPCPVLSKWTLPPGGSQRRSYVQPRKQKDSASVPGQSVGGDGRRRREHSPEAGKQALGMRSSVVFYATFTLCVALGLICVLFVSYWSSHWGGGFAWDHSALQFNWHPVLMVSGLVVVYGNAAVVYRLPFTWEQNKLTWKLVHAGLLLLALLLSVLGLHAVFDNHASANTPHLYSLHSWVGIVAVALFALQWILGLAGFLFPCSPLWFRGSLKPVHVWLGQMILVLSLIACISGINEALLFSHGDSSAEPYSALPLEAKFANSLGVLLVAFGLVVFGILSKNKWQRPETNVESIRLLHADGNARK